MKRQTLLLFAFFVMINAVIAQQINPRQKATIYITEAQEKITGMKMINHSGNLNLPFLCLNAPDHLKGGSKIKLDSVIVSSRSSDNEPWIKVNKQSYLYDKESRLANIVTTSGIYAWEDSPNIARFVYNSEGLVDSVQFFKNPDYLISGMTWYLKFIYDSSGRLYQSTSWDVSGGSLNTRNTYSYNETGRISEIYTEEDWWIYWAYNNKYTYDDEGKLIRYEAPEVYSQLATYGWNNEGQLTEENYSNWYQKMKHLFYYNPDGNRVRSELYFWQLPGGDQDFTLIEYTSEEYSYLDENTYDLANLNLSLMEPGNELDEIDYCPEKLISTTTKYSSLHKYQKSDYYYSPFLITSIDEEINSDFRVFPIPASDHITFSWQASFERVNLKIFQLSGVCVLDREIASHETVRLTGLTKGIYLFKLSENMRLLKTGKLIIE